MSYIYDGRPKDPTTRFHLSRHVSPLGYMSSLRLIKIIPRKFELKVVDESDICSYCRGHLCSLLKDIFDHSLKCEDAKVSQHHALFLLEPSHNSPGIIHTAPNTLRTLLPCCLITILRTPSNAFKSQNIHPRQALPPFIQVMQKRRSVSSFSFICRHRLRYHLPRSDIKRVLGGITYHGDHLPLRQRREDRSRGTDSRTKSGPRGHWFRRFPYRSRRRR